MRSASNCAECDSACQKKSRVPAINIDHLGIGASALCAVHCFVLPFVLVALSAFGIHSLPHDATHRVLAIFVLAFCLAAVIPGYLKHKNKRIIILMALGVSLVMFATFLAAPQFGEGSELPLITTGNALVISAHLLNRKNLRAPMSSN